MNNVDVPYVICSDKATEPQGEAKSEWEIFGRLTKTIGERATERGVGVVRGWRDEPLDLRTVHARQTSNGRYDPLDPDDPMRVMDDIFAHPGNVMGTENAGYYGPLLARHPEGISKGLTERLQMSLKVTGGDYVRSLNARETAYAAVARVLDQHAAILTLSSTGPAPISLASTGNAIFNGMWTLLGVPCISLPLMTVGGMPFGFQLVGKRRDEARLLATARWIEEALG